ETTEYVPKVLAVAVVEKNHQVFGIDEPRPDPPRPFDTISVPPAVTFERLATRLRITADDLATWNPTYPRRRTPVDRGPVDLRVPAGAAARVTKPLDDLRPDNVVPVQVQAGETLVRIAKARKISAARLRSLNAVGDDAEVTPGTTILVPRTNPRPTQNSQNLIKDGGNPPGRQKIASGSTAGKNSTKNR
ncbi:MAG: rane-bound lytic murein transglycosylase, partial [Myxococcales bacterium]|nr:rane-bound lytic murein transglycosylase [Myxococcales bacterium]